LIILINAVFVQNSIEINYLFCVFSKNQALFEIQCYNRRIGLILKKNIIPIDEQGQIFR